MYQQAHAQCTVHFLDESYGAIASSRLNPAAWFRHNVAQASYTAADAPEHQSDESVESVDLILCNPAFHQQHATGDQLTRRLFQASKRCLQQRGELWIVANRHLDYAVILQQLFGNCRTVASNRKFSVYRAIKR